MSKKEDEEYLNPIILEKNIWNMKYAFISLIVGFFLIAIFIAILNYFILDLTQVLILFLALVIIYSVILFFLLEPKKLREIRQPIIRRISSTKPIIKRIYEQIPYETEKRIYITNPPKKQKKQYNFYSSTKSKRYHKNSCRLSKLIKEEYKIGKDSEQYFIKNNHKPCKVCIKNKYPSLK